MARIVFDLDGTLIDSVPDLHAVANSVLADEGAAPITLDDARSYIGDGTAVFVARMRHARGIPDAEQDRILAAYMDRYEGAVAHTTVYPGVRAALDALGRDHALGVCTNKPVRPLTRVLAHFHLARHFRAVVGGDTLPVHKPDPAPLLAAFDELGDGPRLYVGDSEVDATTADRAGVPFLLFTEGYRKGPAADMPHAAAFADWADLPRIAGDLA